ncbi:N-formyl peptide receptor 2 [Biomphalaria pfeifferi]|uniref:N-formyl peptide receptor 2 n=1 Tax=Biomphalaria pfeifferi TaxID=112525 RepID=A0AAD8FAC2_BIOPF|nr:N-formyl peptide receptor 2 [Biomphalaria pfeifferi]
MGFKDRVNITMTFVTFWDLIRNLCGVLHRCYGPISLISPLDGVSWQNITLTNIVYLQLIASNIAYVVSACAAMEQTNSTPVMSTKEGQVVKMLILVIATYMLVLVPRVAHYAAQVWALGYYSMRQYDSIFWTVVYIISLLDFINS